MKFFRKLLLFILIAIVIVGGILYANGYKMYKEAIDKVSISEKVKSVQNNSNFVSIKDVPDYYINAIVSVEDHRFYQHKTIDIISIGRAIISNIKQQEFKEGASTITQQTAKNLYFIEEDDAISRKVAEILVGIDLEKNYSKQQILELYYNTIYFGNGYYGIKEASKGYLNKEPNKMNISDATMLAGVPNAPSVYAPTSNPDLTAKRQKKVISSMVEYGYITQEEANTIKLYTAP